MRLDYNPSRKSIIKNKWVATAASIWIQCTSGALYTFSIYSPILKSTQGYSQSTLNTIAVFKDFGFGAGLLSSIFYNATATAPHGGPWVVLLAGAIQCFVGYFLMWLTVTGVLPQPPVAVMGLYMLLAAHGTTFFNTANVFTGVHNFANDSGAIVGIMQGFLGLSGAVLIQVYQTMLKNNPTSYLLLLALLPTINTLLFMGFVRIFKTKERDEKKHLNGFSYLALTIAFYLTAVIIIQRIFKLTLSVRVFTFVLLILLLLSPIIVAITAHRDKPYWMINSLLERGQVSNETDQPDNDVTNIRQDNGEYHEVPSGPDQVTETTNYNLQGQDNLNLLQAMRTVCFWLLFLTTGCAMGTGLATVNNLSQIGESLGYTSSQINTLVSLWSTWNFLGRFGAGYFSDYLVPVRGSSIRNFFVYTLIAMLAGHCMIALTSKLPCALYVGLMVVGICYGSLWSLVLTIASEMFGKEHLGSIFNAIAVAGPVGSCIFSFGVFGHYYDMEASGYGNTCSGAHCFNGASAAMAFLAYVVLHVAGLINYAFSKDRVIMVP